MHFRGTNVLGLILISAGIIAACSATKDPGTNRRGGAGTNSTATGGSGGSGPLPGTGGTLNLGGATNGESGAEGKPDGGFVEEPVYTCEKNEDCCGGPTGDPNCTDPTTYVCTISNECGKIKSTCPTDGECQADTYCCDAECRKDKATDSVCIPSNIEPGIPCLGDPPPPGTFAPGLQCEWKGTDQYGSYVLTTPLVADLPNDAGAAAEIIFATYKDTAGTVEASNSAPGTLRIISGQDCKLLETITASAGKVRASSTPAIANLDSDPDLEIVARTDKGGLIAFDWKGTKYDLMWEVSAPLKQQAWDGVAVHDITNDGKPEILVWDAVFDATGKQLFAGSGAANFGWNGYIPVVGDLDADGKAEIVAPLGWNGINWYEWNGSGWKPEVANESGARFGQQFTHFAIADFGKAGTTFDVGAFDGKAEIIAVDAEDDSPPSYGGKVSVFTLDGKEVFTVQTKVDTSVSVTAKNESGGPPAVGNLDDDPEPEFAIAGATKLRVFDFSCTGGGNGCAAKGVKWETTSQDDSSRQTGAAIFDFEGDGKAEVIYADECFLRVYSGVDGTVLFSSYRTSGTWLEGPAVADVDNDQSTEIVVNSAYPVSCPAKGGAPNKPYVDPLHPGVRCDNDEGCVNGSKCEGGFCRCTSNEQCCGSSQSLEECGLTCAAPTSGGGGNVCRATHPNSDKSAGGVRVLRDRLDRWVSSRPLWNQHAYSITNINDDGSIPKTSDWVRNWSVLDKKGYNSYRQQLQGTTGLADLPDITGRFTDDKPACAFEGGKRYLVATVCNRGKRAVGAALPGTFYLGDPADNKVLCTSYTDGPVPTGSCKLVYCEVGDDVIGKNITLVVNRDQDGSSTTLECRPDNNRSTTKIGKCELPIPK